VSCKEEFVNIEGRMEVGLGRGRKPVNGERGPLKGLRNEQIVQKRSVLLPNGELFFDFTFIVLFRHFFLRQNFKPSRANATIGGKHGFK